MRNSKEIEFVAFESDTDCAVGDGTVAITIPSAYDGFTISKVEAGGIYTLGVGSTMDIQLRRRRAASEADVLSTKITIDPAEYHAEDGVINAANDDLVTGDNLYVDVDQVHTTPAKGLTVVITIKK